MIHATSHPAVAQRPAYVLSKTAGALYFQLLAQETPRDKIQIITMHPGLVYNDSWKAMGLPEDWFEDGEISILPEPTYLSSFKLTRLSHVKQLTSLADLPSGSPATRPPSSMAVSSGRRGTWKS